MLVRIAENWRLSMRSVVDFVRSQVYDTERPPYLQYVGFAPSWSFYVNRRPA